VQEALLIAGTVISARLSSQTQPVAGMEASASASASPAIDFGRPPFVDGKLFAPEAHPAGVQLAWESWLSQVLSPKG